MSARPHATHLLALRAPRLLYAVSSAVSVATHAAIGLSVCLFVCLSVSSPSPLLGAPPIDAVSPWATGPQAIFTQPALLRSSTEQMAVSYDLRASISGEGQRLGAQRLGLSLPLNERYTLALGAWRARGGPSLSPQHLDEQQADFTAISLAQSLRLMRRLSVGLSLAHLWIEGATGEARERSWLLQLGLSYEPVSWLRFTASSPDLSPSAALGDQPALSARAQLLGLAWRPSSWLALGAGLSPSKGGGLWSSSARLRLWRGLGLEARYLGTINPERRLARPLSLALTWGGDWGWRAELSPEDDGSLGSELTASLRVGGAPETHQLDSSGRALLLIAHRGEEELSSRGSLIGSGRVSAPLLKTLQALRAARSEPTVERVALLLNSANLGWAQAEELAEELRALRALGREVTVFLPSVDSTSYLVAAEASEVWVRPTSELRLSGLLTERFYLKGLLEMLNIQAEMIAIGDYKSAPEMFLREGPSPEASVAQRAVLDGRYERLLLALERRCLSHKAGCAKDAKGELSARAQAEAWLREGPYNAREAEANGLIDRVVHAVELDRALKSAYPQLTLNVSSPPLIERSWGPPDTLAVLYLVGDIGASSSLGSKGVTASQLVPLIHSLERRDEVKGVVLRVDSPGGAISDADEIWKSLQRLAERKPLVASMGDVAASGGYYVAAPARLIFASPNTITGSIGVFAGKANLSPALERLGITVHRDRRGEGGGEASLFTPWTEAQRSKIKRSMEGLYELFLQRVSVGRPSLTRERLLPLAGGRVWTGAQAKAQGLVDEEGGLLDALSALAQLTQLTEGQYQLEVVAPTPPSLLDQVSGLKLSLTRGASVSALSTHPLWATLPDSFKGLMSLLLDHSSVGLAYLPYW